ncbi:MAG TPA: 50S ribosomal protein L25 [Actinobacteria bacterium]|nr:50S ribosomal protein L25 [Actinomycetota bacterium]
MSETTLRAETGRVIGTRSSRRLRRDGMVPGVLYGKQADPLSLAVNARDLSRALSTEAGLNVVLTIEVDGNSSTAFARELQRHPTRGDIIHLDFIKITLTDTVDAVVSLDFLGEPVGVRDEGGIIHTVMTSVNVRAVVTDIPSSIEIDIADLEIGDSVTVEDLPEIDGVEYLDESDSTVATVAVPAAVLADETEVDGEEVEGEDEDADGEGEPTDGADAEDE